MSSSNMEFCEEAVKHGEYESVIDCLADKKQGGKRRRSIHKKRTHKRRTHHKRRHTRRN